MEHYLKIPDNSNFYNIHDQKTIENDKKPEDELIKEVRLNLMNDLHFLNQNKSFSIQEVSNLTKNKIFYKTTFTKTDPQYIEYKSQLKELRDRKLPFRIIDKVKKQVKKDGDMSHGLREEYHKKLPEYLLTPTKNSKNLMQKFESDLLTQSCGLEENLNLAENALWFHGTNSSILPLLSHTNYQLVPTGRLLDCGLAPMSGEINLGGMKLGAANQTGLSTDTIRNFERCWNYATQVSKTFNADHLKSSNQEYYFLQNVNFLKTLSPGDDQWDPAIIDLMRFKQWQPEIFDELTKKFSSEIIEVKKSCMERNCYLENLILKALDYNLDELKDLSPEEFEAKLGKAFPGFNLLVSDLFQSDSIKNLYKNQDHFKSLRINWKYIVINILRARASGDEGLKELIKQAAPDNVDLDTVSWRAYDETVALRGLKKGLSETEELTAEKLINSFIRNKINTLIQVKMRPLQKRYNRMLSLFDSPPKIHLTEQERSLITNPFPLLLSSSKAKSYCQDGVSEFHLSTASFGKEIDLIFAEPKDFPVIQQWLKEHQLENLVSLKDINLLMQLKKLSSIPQ